MYRINRRTVLTCSVAAFAVTGFDLAHATTLIPTKHTVIIKGFRFQPDPISVRVDDTITWINQDIAPHTATADAGDWDTAKLEKGESHSVEITAGMTGNYFCKFHPKMKGEIIIK